MTVSHTSDIMEFIRLLVCVLFNNIISCRVKHWMDWGQYEKRHSECLICQSIFKPDITGVRVVCVIAQANLLNKEINCWTDLSSFMIFISLLYIYINKMYSWYGEGAYPVGALVLCRKVILYDIYNLIN
jgi:hypothetical protein